MTPTGLLVVLCLFCSCIYGQAAGSPAVYSATVFHTYPEMTNAGIEGTMIYDVANRIIAFKYPAPLGLTEIYKFNSGFGYGSGVDNVKYADQFVWKVAPYSACTPCAQYSNYVGFPFTNNNKTNWVSAYGVPASLANIPSSTVDPVTRCRRYDTPAGVNSFMDYFLLNEDNGRLCSLADFHGRVWTVTGDWSTTYDQSILTPPEGCKCLQPIDISLSLDRSSSINVEETRQLKDFVSQLVNSFYFNRTDSANTAQLTITQWGTVAFPLSHIGNLNFTTDSSNVATASGLVGCTSRSGNCAFCCDDDCPPSEDERCINSPTQYTCAACGIRNMADQWTRVNTTYINRTAAKKISIVLTDGNTNTLYGGGDCGSTNNNLDRYRCRNRNGDWTECTTSTSNCRDNRGRTTTCSFWYHETGCYYDITQARNYLLSQVPGIETFAIGVGTEINSETLNYISGSSSRSFVEDSFDDLLENLQKYVLGFCPLPDPNTECGRCCGFCECGVCVPPTRPIPPPFCANYTISNTTNSGGCYYTVPKTQLCPTRNCQTATCNSAASRCDYVDNCDKSNNPNLNGCFDWQCALNTTQNLYTCQPYNYQCTPGNATCPCPVVTDPPTLPPPTNAPTAPLAVPVEPPPPPPCGGACGAHGNCDTDNETCVCTDNYTGVLCGIPPDIIVDFCVNDTSCFQDFCIDSRCVVGPSGGKECTHEARDCDDGDDCTTDSCDPASGCANIPIDCDDGLVCTDDACVAGVCQNVELNCSAFADQCNNAVCDDFALNDTERCILQSIECERKSNCSITECRKEEGGCVSEEYTCNPAFIGVAVGVAAGVIGGVVAAGAFLLCAAATAGGGYAVSKNYDHEADGAVHISPLYRPETKTGAGMACQ